MAKVPFTGDVSVRVAIMAESKVRLYVKSVKTMTGTREVEREMIRTRARMIETESTRDRILSEDHQKAAEMIRRIACKHGFEVEVVDVARENVLRRILQKEREGIRVFPTLVARSRERLEGSFTEMQVESVFSRWLRLSFAVSSPLSRLDLHHTQVERQFAKGLVM